MAAFVLSQPLPRFHAPLSFKKTKTSLLILATASKTQAATYELRQGQYRIFHRLPSSGLRMEAIVQNPPPGEVEGHNHPPMPPLVFVHGSFHAAWCWAEHWLPFFSCSGHRCFAVSLLAQGESDVPRGSSAGTLQTHTSDVADFIRKEVGSPPVLIGHSFGGLIVQSYLSRMADGATAGGEDLHPLLAGAILLCSVPPSGNSGLVWRYLFTKPVAAIKVTLSLAAKAFETSLPLCKETFFSCTMDDHLVLRYQELMKESSKLPLFDLKKLNTLLPVPSLSNKSIQLLVVGASDDFIVDLEGLHETAKFYGLQPVCVEGVAHDMMLDTSWEKGAEIILAWLKNLYKQTAVQFAQ